MIFLPDEPLCIRWRDGGVVGGRQDVTCSRRLCVCVCMCVSLSESEAGFSHLTFRGVPTQWVVTDVAACACMLCRCVVHVTHESVFSLLHYRGIDVMGADREVYWAGELCSCCRLYPSQSHFQLERGWVRQKEKTTEEKRKRDKALEIEREEGTECIYTWVMDLLWNDFFVLGGG